MDDYNYDDLNDVYNNTRMQAKDTINDFCNDENIQKLIRNIPLAIILIGSGFALMAYSIHLLELRDEEGNRTHRFQGSFYLSISIVYLIILTVIYSCEKQTRFGKVKQVGRKFLRDLM